MSDFFSVGNPYWLLLMAFAVAAGAAGLLRLAGGPGRGAALSGAGIAFGFLAAWLMVLGLPPFPPRGLLEQVPYAAAAGMLAGVVAVALSVRRMALLVLIVAFAALAVWAALGFRLSWSWPMALRAAVILAAWLVALLRLESRPAKEPVAAVMALVAAVGLGGIAVMAGEPTTGRLAFALAAATGGFLLWNWFAGLPYLAPAVLGGGGPLMALAAALVLSGRASPWPVLVLLLVFFADGTARRLPAGSGLVRRLFQPVILALVCLIPVLLALIVAYVAARMPQ